MSDCAICRQSTAEYCIRCKNRLEFERDYAREAVRKWWIVAQRQERRIFQIDEIMMENSEETMLDKEVREVLQEYPWLGDPAELKREVLD